MNTLTSSDAGSSFTPVNTVGESDGWSVEAPLLVWWNLNYRNLHSRDGTFEIHKYIERQLKRGVLSVCLQEVLASAIPRLSELFEGYGYNTDYTNIGPVHDSNEHHGLFMGVDKRLSGGFAAQELASGLPLQTFRHPDYGEPLLQFANIHLPPPMPSKISNRRQIIQAIRSWLSQRSSLVLVGGDFNTAFGTPSVLSKYQVDADHLESTWCGPMGASFTMDRIFSNYVIPSAHNRVDASTRISDHRPVELYANSLLGLYTSPEGYPVIKDQYLVSRGGDVSILSLRCRSCGALVGHYQKDGPGPLIRCYFDRFLTSPIESGNPRTWSADSKELLRCPVCERVLGEGVIYEKENRPAFRLFSDAFSGQFEEAQSV